MFVGGGAYIKEKNMKKIEGKKKNKYVYSNFENMWNTLAKLILFTIKFLFIWD